MEVDEIDRDGRAYSEDHDTSGFEVLVKSIKTLEKEAKTREQQLVGKHEQERLKWHQEKQELLEQLRQKQSPYKVPKSPARPVLGAVSPNKQQSPVSKSSQATSDISFRDVFTSPSNKTHTSFSHHVSPRHPSSPNRLLDAELKAVNKELKRVKHKYQALYEAQEEILRKRNQDRDKWRHFKNVVKTATATRPDFQLELRKADALLKKQEEESKNVNNDDVQPNQPTASAAIASTTTELSMGPFSLSTPTRKKSYPRVTASEAGRHTNEELKSPSPQKCRQYGSQPNGKKEDGRALKAAPTTSMPTTFPNHAPVGLIRSESPFTVSTQAAQPISSTPRPLPILATPVVRATNGSSQLQKQKQKFNEEERKLERFRRIEEFYFLEGNMNSGRADQEAKEIWDDDDIGRSYAYEAHLYYIAVYDGENELEEPGAPGSAAVEAFEKSEYESDMQVLQRIYAEYEPIPCAKDVFPTKWILDGKELVGPAIAPAAAAGAEHGQDEMQRPPSNPSQPSTVEDLSFWSEEGEFAPSVVESVPTEVEFGSYQPGTADSYCSAVKVSNTEENPNQGDIVASASSQQVIIRNSGVPYLYPLPQDLQSRVPPDQDVLEESLPIRRVKAPRLSAFSDITFASIEEERIWKPFESRLRRSPASSNDGFSPPLQVASSSAVFVKREITSRKRENAMSDEEATEASSSPLSQTQHQQPTPVFDVDQAPALEVGQGAMTGDATPVTCQVLSTSTVKSSCESRKDVISPTNQADKAPTFSAGIVSLETPGQKGREAPPEDELSASSGEDEHLDGDAIEEERIPSYAPSQLLDQRVHAMRKTISDEKIGPRRPSSVIKLTRKAENLVPATESFCEIYLARVTGKGETSIKSTQLPLGKPIGVPQLDDIPKGTPTAWHNMSSKRRAPNTALNGTPSSVAGFMSSKRAISGAKMSSAAVVIASVPPHQSNIKAPAESASQTIKPLRAFTPMQGVSINHSIPKKETLSPPGPGSDPRPAAVEQVTGPLNQPKAKRPRKSAGIPDAEVESDLQLVGNAIIRRTSFVLGAKREAPPQTFSEENPSKKSRKSLEVDASAEKVSRKTTSKNAASAASRRTVVEQKWVHRHVAERDKSTDIYDKELHSIRKQEKALQEKISGTPNLSDHATREVKVKVEDAGDYGSENSEESEEFLGQRFMRKVHEERRKTMQADPLKSKGRGAYAAQVQAARSEAGPTSVGRSEVAHKETIRGREARQAVHGVNCPCCTAYYEYKTRNLPLEERAKAAAEMVNEVSRHRQNWEAAESPPGYWQMGFPSTEQVERLNEEAVEMKKEKRERQKKENAADNNCGGRRDYKVI